MKKLVMGLILVLAIIFTVFFSGEKEVLSTANPSGVNNVTEEESKNNEIKEENNDTEDNLQEIVEEKPSAQEPVITDLTYEEVLQLIESDNKKIVDNPSDYLVLVNKENNLLPTYVPEDLVIPDVPFSFQGEDQKKYLRKGAAQALEALIAKAREEGHEILAVSGYRSYERQKSIFLGNVKKHGFKKANTFSALPGQSEHQTGLAMDVSAASVNYSLSNNFGETPEGMWLNENAHLFGFIIRYPRDKVQITGYQYEPWHIRYVGIETATEIKMNNLTLEEYLD